MMLMDDTLHDNQHMMISHMLKNQTKAVKLLQGMAIEMASLELRVTRLERYIAAKQKR
jgi:hypothetical protein